MIFDFNINQFILTESASDKDFIVGSDKVLNQKEVYAAHLKLKSTLQKISIPKGHPVCIYGEKEAFFPIAMITLISMDIPYVPIDAIMPFGRIQKIKDETKSLILINCSTIKCEVEFDFVIDSKFELQKESLNTEFHLIHNQIDPVRYILFTSGSTGQPKGVQITKSALNSFVDWYTKWPMINNEAVFMNQAPFSFDVSLCDFIGTFALGAKMILNNYSILKSPNEFIERLHKNEANTIVCTPAFMQMYLSIPEFNQKNFPLLRQFVFMGEELPALTVKKIKVAFPNIKVVNAYGPTEATVVTTYIEITDEVLKNNHKSLPIGYPRDGGKIVVMDVDQETGFGELGIIGPHLSIGYFNDVEKTNTSFQQFNGERVYKTGDLGFINDGIVFYAGRNDSQVKLNGYRIELDEITSVLLNHPKIENAVTVPLKSGNITKKIISFITLKSDLSELNATLKDYLQQYVPSYMIPSDIVCVEEMPLNQNYKVDKKALIESYLNGN